MLVEAIKHQRRHFSFLLGWVTIFPFQCWMTPPTLVFVVYFLKLKQRFCFCLLVLEIY